MSPIASSAACLYISNPTGIPIFGIYFKSGEAEAVFCLSPASYFAVKASLALRSDTGRKKFLVTC
jgi:hypothetical protein